ncbi:hypothetical protein CN128_33610 [Sinorhizobium meliloti]|nr:hypothetical protein CDO24_28990 [Sinorhizobium meliloti]PTD30447.1 hypothetical protein C5N13_02675 [Sinorhizobium meliloti]RVH55817.1 hypothetical protein CN198_34920 [Sinorhizobium meliloti]RVI34623.1 hypothetical protein CN202_07390 [Sinorhizobium meliloti]RVK58683.1 hypothetical protein CN159_34535 [Sinorhizobium meliloti]
MNTTRPALIHTEEDQARQINAEAWNKVARDALPRRRALPRHQVPQPVQSARTPFPRAGTHFLRPSRFASRSL